MKWMTLFFLLVSSVCLAGLDVNDVSLLFPISQGKLNPEINVGENKILKPEILQQILKFEYPQRDVEDLPYIDLFNIKDLSHWLVTSTRFELCGDTLMTSLSSVVDVVVSGNLCQPRLRLVLQPFTQLGTPLPSAIHLLYKLEKKDSDQVIQKLILMKSRGESELGVTTTGVPLDVHPALAEEIRQNKFVVSNLLKEMILKVTGQESKLEIATLILRISLNHWKLVGGHLTGGEWKRMTTPFSQQFANSDFPESAGIEELLCDNFSVCLMTPRTLDRNLNPEGTILTEIFEDDSSLKKMQTPGHRSERLMVKAEEIDDVRKTHFFNTNCISCHESSNLRDREKLHTDLNLTQGLTPFVSRLKMGRFTNNVINFGYLGGIARISTRTAAESVKVADDVNSYLGELNPAPAIENLNLFWQCINQQSDFSVCFKKEIL